MTAILKKSEDIKWEKIGNFFDIDEEKLPGVKALKEAEVSILFDSSQCKHFGSVLEKWPPVTFDWHYECDEIFYIISGGPMKVTCEGEVMEGAAGGAGGVDGGGAGAGEENNRPGRGKAGRKEGT